MPFIGDIITKQLPPRIEKRKLFGIIPYKKTILEWEVYEPLTYVDEIFEIKITVPKGATTDFASTPRIVWPVLPPVGRYSGPAIVHDYMYRHGLYNRKIADFVFLHAMMDIGVPTWKQVVMFEAVRLFGWKSYRKLEKLREG